MQRLAQRGGLHAQRALHFQRRLIACGAIEGECERSTDQSDLETRTIAGQRRQKVAQREARFDVLLVPGEVAVGAKAARDRRPRHLKLEALQPLSCVATSVVENDGPVLNADFRERGDALGLRRQRARKRRYQTRPIGLTGRRERDSDGRTHQGHVGDLDAAGQQWKISQPRNQLVGSDRRLAGGLVGEHDVAKAHASGWKQQQ